MVRILKHPRTLPATHYKAIGKVAMKWSLVEVHLQSLAWHFLALGFKEGRVLTYRLPSRAKIELLQAVCLRWVKDAATKREVESISEAASSLNDRRNEIVHGVWGHEPSTPKKLELLYIKKNSEKILPRSRVCTKSDVEAIASAIDALYLRIVRLHRSIGAKLP